MGKRVAFTESKTAARVNVAGRNIKKHLKQAVFPVAETEQVWNHFLSYLKW